MSLSIKLYGATRGDSEKAFNLISTSVQSLKHAVLLCIFRVVPRGIDQASAAGRPETILGITRN